MVLAPLVALVPHSSSRCPSPAASPEAADPAANPPLAPVRGTSVGAVVGIGSGRPNPPRISANQAADLARVLDGLGGEPFAFFSSPEVRTMVDVYGYTLTDLTAIYPPLIIKAARNK